MSFLTEPFAGLDLVSLTSLPLAIPFLLPKCYGIMGKPLCPPSFYASARNPNSRLHSCANIPSTEPPPPFSFTLSIEISKLGSIFFLPHHLFLVTPVLKIYVRMFLITSNSVSYWLILKFFSLAKPGIWFYLSNGV